MKQRGTQMGARDTIKTPSWRAGRLPNFIPFAKTSAKPWITSFAWAHLSLLLSLGLLLFLWGEWCEKWFYCSNHSVLYTVLFIQQTFLSAYYVLVLVVETLLLLTLWILQSSETYTHKHNQEGTKK